MKSVPPPLSTNVALARWDRPGALRWSWPAALAILGLASVGGAILGDRFAAASVLLACGIALATVGVGWHLVGTWRADRSL